LGVLAAGNYHPERAELMAKLGLNSDSVTLVINTEGDTATKDYREDVWEGKKPAQKY
ncbi:diaminopropionate ammonia-lyase, partial [Morganella morganii]|nr:diaminopropionate ammonia-lyase [Morganella morganii]